MPFDVLAGPDPFPAPAPPGPYTAAMAHFNGSDPNGAWQLFVMDDDFDQGGRVDGGWTLELLPTARCAGRQASVPSDVGTAGDDKLIGKSGDDVMLGLGGRDTISGRGGDDLICGGAGKDTLRGGAGMDRLLGEGGKDKLKGNGGKDVCKGGAGRDTAGACEKTGSL